MSQTHTLPRGIGEQVHSVLPSASTACSGVLNIVTMSMAAATHLGSLVFSFPS